MLSKVHLTSQSRMFGSRWMTTPRWWSRSRPFLDFPVAQMVKNLPTMQETRDWSLGQEDLLEKGMAAHSSILAWRIPWTEKSGGLQSVGSQRVRHDWATNTHTHTHTHTQNCQRSCNIRQLTVYKCSSSRDKCWPCSLYFQLLQIDLFKVLL